MGVWSSCSEAVRFAAEPEIKFSREGVYQYIYVNADFNTETIDGYNMWWVELTQ